MAKAKESHSKNNKNQRRKAGSGFSSPYAQAARILNEIWLQKRGFKSVVYDKKTGDLTCSKQTYAQVSQVLKYKNELEQVWKGHKRQEANDTDGDTTKNKTKNEVKNHGLLLVLLYELLLGPNKAIRGGGALKRQIMQSETQLRASMAKLEETTTRQQATKQAALHFPRYARINTLWNGGDYTETIQRLQKHLEEATSTRRQDGDDADDDDKSSRRPPEIFRDKHVPDLLVLQTANGEDVDSVINMAKLQQDQFLKHGIVLQDKSSCFSALCLARGFDSPSDHSRRRVYLDACAAPGNKTCHLAALVQQNQSHVKENKTTITVNALDRSTERCATLKRRMQQFVPAVNKQKGSKVKVVVQGQDFLQTPKDAANGSDKKRRKKPAIDGDDEHVDSDLSAVTDILLDPSCSGSGIFTSIDREEDENEKDGSDGNGSTTHMSKKQLRLQSLAGFQLKALTHAMTAFPRVERIVYSTCSIHEEENEQVVAKALAMDQEGESQWELIAPKCLRDWPCRGRPISTPHGESSTAKLSPEQAKCLIRVDDPKYETNGFFVACFQKRNTERSLNDGESADAAKGDENSAWTSVPIYEGKRLLRSNTKAKKANEVNEPQSEATKTGSNDETRDAESSNKTSSLPKKIARKLEWKRRQREAKEQRLRAKKAAKAKK